MPCILFRRDSLFQEEQNLDLWRLKTFFSERFASSTERGYMLCPSTTTARCRIVPGLRITGNSGWAAARLRGSRGTFRHNWHGSKTCARLTTPKCPWKLTDRFLEMGRDLDLARLKDR